MRSRKNPESVIAPAAGLESNWFEEIEGFGAVAALQQGLARGQPNSETMRVLDDPQCGSPPAADRRRSRRRRAARRHRNRAVVRARRARAVAAPGRRQALAHLDRANPLAQPREYIVVHRLHRRAAGIGRGNGHDDTAIGQVSMSCSTPRSHSESTGISGSATSSSSSQISLSGEAARCRRRPRRSTRWRSAPRGYHAAPG